MPSATAALAFAKTTGPVTFALEAADAEVDVDVVPGLDTATAEIRGPERIRAGARFSTDGSTWSLRLPEPARVANNVRGSGGTVFSGVSAGGSVTIAGGDITINNRRVTGQPHAVSESVRILVRLPEGSALRIRMAAGFVQAQGHLAAVEHDTTSADLVAETIGALRARTVSGNVEADRVDGPAVAETTSGDIDLGGVGGPLRARTVSGDATAAVSAAAEAESVSGDLRIHAAATVRITARSNSGDVRITAAPGAAPLVDADSRTGRVRTP